MKSFLIVFLLVALLAVAFATRPGRRELMLYMLDSRSGAGWGHAEIDQVDQQARNRTIRDRYLWTDVEKDGKVIYTGAFSHWLPRGQNAQGLMPATADLAKLVGK